MSPLTDLSLTKLDRPPFSSVNKRSSIFVATMARPQQPASDSRKLIGAGQVLEKNLQVHYPQLRIADSLFSEFDSHDFAAIDHKAYSRVLRELSALQNRLFDCTKFEKLIRYRCANLFFLVLPTNYFANRKFRSAGARSSNQTARSRSCLSPSARRARPKTGFDCCSESRPPEREC